MKKVKENSLQDLIQKYPNYLIAIYAGDFYKLYYESAKIINEIFGYKLYEDKHSYFSRTATGFPTSFLKSITEELRTRKIKFVIVRNYKIIDINDDGEDIVDTFEKKYNEDYLVNNLKYLIVDEWEDL